MAKLTVVISETIDDSAMKVVKRLHAPNVLSTTFSEYPTLEIEETIDEIILSIEAGHYSLNELKNIIEKVHPTQIALHNIQKIYEQDFRKTNWLSLSSKARYYVSELQTQLAVPITMIGTAIFDETMVDLR